MRRGCCFLFALCFFPGCHRCAPRLPRVDGGRGDQQGSYAGAKAASWGCGAGNTGCGGAVVERGIVVRIGPFFYVPFSFPCVCGEGRSEVSLLLLLESWMGWGMNER